MRPMVKPHDAPRLDWLTATEVATTFGISRQAVNAMVRSGDFESLHLLGPESRPQYVFARSEVEGMKRTRTFPRAKSRNP